MSDKDEQIKGRVYTRYRNYPLVSDHFPLVLRNDAKINTITAKCGRCGKNIGEEFFRGVVSPSPDYRLKVTAIGECVHCTLLSPFLFVITPEGDKFTIQNMEYRGWMELFENKVIEWDAARQQILKKKERRRKKLETVQQKKLD